MGALGVMVLEGFGRPMTLVWMLDVHIVWYVCGGVYI